MKSWIIIGLCIFLIACRPEYILPEGVEDTNEDVIEVNEEQVKAKRNFESLQPTRTVKQTGDLGNVNYKLTEDNKLLSIEKTGVTWSYDYQKGKLAEINGNEDISFFYEKGFLSSIDRGAVNQQFKHDSRGRVTEAKDNKETLHFDYDSLDQIRGVRKGVAGKTSIDYFKDGKIKYLTKGMKTTNLHYDEYGRVRDFDADDIHFVLGYWRDDKLISLTGKRFGRGLAVSYDGPPTYKATIIHEGKKINFESAYTDTLYKVVDEYLYCNHIRILKDLMFESWSYTVFVNYFDSGMEEYLKKHYYCVGYEV